MNKQKKLKLRTKQQRRNKTTRCKQENHLVFLQKKIKADNTDTKQYNNSLFRLKTNNTRKAKTITKTQKHKNKLPSN